MGVAILPSQETLAQAAMLRSRQIPLPDANHESSPNLSNSRRRKRSPVGFESRTQDRQRNRSQSRSMVVKFPSKNLVQGQVKILQRGEMLSWVMNSREFGVVGDITEPRMKHEDDLLLALGSIDRLDPDPDLVRKQVKLNGVYSGSGFFTSPPPSSLPFPGFLEENGGGTCNLQSATPA